MVETGAISTEHSSSDLRVIRTNVHRANSSFLHLTMHIPNLTLLYVVQLTLSPDNPLLRRINCVHLIIPPLTPFLLFQYPSHPQHRYLPETGNSKFFIFKTLCIFSTETSYFEKKKLFETIIYIRKTKYVFIIIRNGHR